MSRPVHAEVELLFDVPGATRPGDHNQIRRPGGCLRLLMGPMSKSPVHPGHLEHGDVGLRCEARHSGPTGAMFTARRLTLDLSWIGQASTQSPLPVQSSDATW